MKIVLICNNFGANYDGIGAYSRKIFEVLKNYVDDIKICTSYCESTKFLNKILGLGMTFATFKACRYILFEKFDKAVIEYPFVEWNPLFCISVLLLKISTILTNKKLVITIHEFKRSNVIRKLVIIYLALLANEILVTEKENIALLKKYNTKLKKINIPSNITINFNSKYKKEKEFVYFGIVNKAKAFYEMIEAWDEFNHEGKYKLYCITSSQLKNMDSHKNVEYIYNAKEEIINVIMCKSAFSILPIKPFIDEKNTTFKTSCLAGCVSVGLFCDEYRRLPFVINTGGYEKKSFIKAFEKCININNSNINKMIISSAEFGKKYDIVNNVKKYLNAL